MLLFVVVSVFIVAVPHAPAALRTGAVDVELEIFGRESLISPLRKDFQEGRVLYFLYFAAFCAYEMLVVGGGRIDYLLKLGRFVAKPMAPYDACVGEKLYRVVYGGPADSEAAVVHSPADSLDVEVLVHAQHHVENCIPFGGAAQVLCREISVKGVYCRCFYFVVSHTKDKGNKFFISRKNNHLFVSPAC